MTRSTDITNFTDFRAHLRDHLDERKKTSRPLFVTNNGETEAVVLSATAYDELLGQAELARSLSMLDRGIDDMKNGSGRPLKQAVRDIASKLGLSIDR